MEGQLSDEDRKRIYEEEKAKDQAKGILKAEKRKLPLVRIIILGLIAYVIGAQKAIALGLIFAAAAIFLFSMLWKSDKKKRIKDAQGKITKG